MNDFLDKFECTQEGCEIRVPHDHAEVVEICVSCLQTDCNCEDELASCLTEPIAETAANALIGEACRNSAWLDFVRTPVEGEVYRASEYR